MYMFPLEVLKHISGIVPFWLHRASWETLGNRLNLPSSNPGVSLLAYVFGKKAFVYFLYPQL